MTADEKLERELESFLAEENSRVAALYRKLPRQEPDSRIDDAVLAMARRAVAPRRRRNGWLPALSAAALVVVAVGIAYRSAPTVWNNRGAEPTPSESRTLDQAAPSATVATPAPAPPPAPASEMAVPLPAPSTTPTMAAKVSRPEPADTQASNGVARQRIAPRAVPPAAVPASPKTEQFGRFHDDRAAAPPLPAAAAMQPIDAMAAQEAKQNTADKADSSGSAQSKAMKSVPETAVPARGTQLDMSRADQYESRLYPEHWLADIRTMLSENRRDDALRNLDRFRKQYPDYPLPDDLRDLK